MNITYSDPEVYFNIEYLYKDDQFMYLVFALSDYAGEPSSIDVCKYNDYKGSWLLLIL